MNTLDFFRAVLPATGNYYLVLKGEQGWRHIMLPSLEMLADKAQQFDAVGKEGVYMACATYRDNHVMRPDPVDATKQKKFYRVAENRMRVKSFWIDLDSGEDKADAGKGYATKGEAWGVMKKFCADVDMKLPLLVDSGNGLHCWWPLTKDISHEKWAIVATAFKRLLAEHGVLADTSRTSDSGSVLRPVGTHNRKGEAKPVVVKFPGEGAYTPEEFAAVMNVSALPVTSEDVPAYLKAAPVTNSLAEHKTEYPPSSAKLVASKCRQMARMRDTKGQVEYPIWFKCLGVIKHTTEGLELAQEWSSEGDGYSEYATATKYHSWYAGPTTCQSFFDDNPAGCAGCKYRDGLEFKIGSPIALGSTDEDRTKAKTVNACNIVHQFAARFAVGGVQ